MKFRKRPIIIEAEEAKTEKTTAHEGTLKPIEQKCKNCGHEIMFDKGSWYHNAKCYVDGCECHNPEPQEKLEDYKKVNL